MACKRPQLKTEAEDSSAKDIIAVEPVNQNSIEGKRKAVIGRTFESITLGEHRFTGAEIRDITDEGILVAHAGGLDEISWDKVPQNVREQWGYNPAKKSIGEKLVETLSGSGLIDELDKPTPLMAGDAPEKTPKPGTADQVHGFVQLEKRLEAQRVGVQGLESDLSRHTISLNSLRAELQTVQALQSSQRSGGLRVERINGESTIVDRRKEVGELKAKIQLEEQLIAQLAKSLQKARQQYQALNAELIRLRQ
ncbi:MAG: hypothetical protein P1U58_15560 [Verrucomicrobiales bacterium]|nr:hypothetical protein [Verrucomicrobiales bacterium]